MGTINIAGLGHRSFYKSLEWSVFYETSKKIEEVPCEGALFSTKEIRKMVKEEIKELGDNNR